MLTFTTPVSQSVAVSIDPGVSETTAFTVAIHHSVASLDPAYDWGTTNTPDVIASYLVGNVVGRASSTSMVISFYDAGETPLPGATVSLAGGSVACPGNRQFGAIPFSWRAAGAIRRKPCGARRATLALAEERTVNVGLASTPSSTFRCLPPA